MSGVCGSSPQERLRPLGAMQDRGGPPGTGVQRVQCG